MPPNLGITEPAPLSLMALLLNLLLGTVMSIGLSWHYTRFGRTKSNRAELAQVFPLIVLTTILVISVVKSSLALSLGLVGALSIVRFRTPIKEPEELSYLFMAIAVGLGLGADQRIPTLLAYVLILTVLATMRRLPSPYRQAKHNLYLNIEVPQNGTERQSENGAVEHSGNQTLATIHEILALHTYLADLRRLDTSEQYLQATYYINCRDSQVLIALIDNLRQTLPYATISCVEQRGILEE
jgi:uncharacterized membrane protein YhiD involved in acid resistance